MTTPVHTIARLAAFFDATNALHARILALHMPRSTSAHFFANAEHRGDPEFSCSYLDTASNHTTFTLRPFVLDCQHAWTTFVTHARSCDPSLVPSTLACVQNLWKPTIPNTTPLCDRPIRLVIGRQRLNFCGHAACLAHLYAHFVQVDPNSDLAVPSHVPF